MGRGRRAACEAGKPGVGGAGAAGKSGAVPEVRACGGQGVLEVRKSGVFREVLGGQEAWKSRCLNSRIVTIIFETENLLFRAREAIRLFLLGNPGRPRACAWLGQCSEGGLRVVWGLLGFSDSRSRPARSQPARGCGSAEGYVRRAVAVALSGFRFPVRPVLALSPAVQGLLAASRCAPGTGFRRRPRPG